MTDRLGLEPLRAEIGRHLRERSGSDAETASCLGEDVVAHLADGTASPEVRAAAVEHLAGCARCRAELAEVIRALRDPLLVRWRPGGASGWRLLVRVAVPLAAAAGLVLILRPALRDDSRVVHRDRGVSAAPAPSPRAPVGVVARAGALSWSPVAGADRYRVTLFDGARVLYDAELRDTLAPLPDSVGVRSGRTYAWKVEARTGVDRWVSSALVRFSVVPEPRP